MTDGRGFQNRICVCEGSIVSSQMKYCGNGKPYIYVSFAKDDAVMATAYMNKLSEKGVLFWYADTINRRELRHIEGAHAVLVFVSQKHFRSDEFHKVVNQAVKCNKNILTVYLEDLEMDAWGHMQLDSAQAFFVNEYANEEMIFAKLCESQIFRDMQVTTQQKRFKRNTSISAVLITLVSAALIFGIIVYPLLIAPTVNDDGAMQSLGLQGLTQEELDQITEINIIGNDAYTDVADIRIENIDKDGKISYSIDFTNGNSEHHEITRGGISDISDLVKCRNLRVLRICANNVKDVSVLAELPKLEHIVLKANPIYSLKGLEALNNVNELSLDYTDISDLTSIENWKSLKVLSVAFTYVDELPETGVMENLDYMSVEGSMVTEIPYMGTGEDKVIIAHRLPKPIDDYSFLRDVDSFKKLAVADAKKEELLQYIKYKPILEFNCSNMNINSLEDLSDINMRAMGRLDVCNTQSLTSLKGFGHFQGIGELVLKGCDNLSDVSQIQGDKINLRGVVISHSMPENIQNEIKKGIYEVRYEDN